MDKIVIIGAGQSGASLVAKLRALGYGGSLDLIGAEPVLPYQRPPLSKAYLTGEMTQDRLFLRPAQFYEDQDITLHLGQPVTRIDPDTRQVHLGDKVLAYDALALTTGAAPRHLPAAIGGDLAGVYTLRDLADVDAMRAEFAPGRRALVIGGGYIGLEAAAVARKLGVEVVLIEMADRILQRVAAPQTSDYFRALHMGHGVDIREGVGLARLMGDTRVTGAEFDDGSMAEFDFALVGIGVTPGDALARDAGLAVDNGITVNAQGRTNDAAIWAAGDCTSLPYNGAHIRLESVQNAIDQAEAVATNMLGDAQDYVPKPWFWSDQYDIKLQIAGLNTGYDRVFIRAGLSHWYYRGGQLISVDAMNDPRAYLVGKRLIEAGRSPAPDTIMDPATNLKALLK